MCSTVATNPLAPWSRGPLPIRHPCVACLSYPRPGATGILLGSDGMLVFVSSVERFHVYVSDKLVRSSADNKLITMIGALFGTLDTTRFDFHNLMGFPSWKVGRMISTCKTSALACMDSSMSVSYRPRKDILNNSSVLIPFTGHMSRCLVSRLLACLLGQFRALP
jgi:hypothetical protein